MKTKTENKETPLEENFTVKISCKNLINALIHKNFTRDHDYCHKYREIGDDILSNLAKIEKILNFLQAIDRLIQDTEPKANEKVLIRLLLCSRGSLQEIQRQYSEEDFNWALEMVNACEAAAVELSFRCKEIRIE